jgi:hypothetical protein
MARERTGHINQTGTDRAEGEEVTQNGSKNTARACMVCDRLCGRGALSRICGPAGSFDDSELYNDLLLMRLVMRLYRPARIAGFKAK